MTDTLAAEVEVEAPLHTVYNQWTQFEEFPEFLHAVKSVEQVDDDFTHWVVSVGGLRREFDAIIVDQVPDSLISWASVDGKAHAGHVSFRAIDDYNTHVKLQMVWEPETLFERTGAALGLDERQVRMDLDRFKDFIENRGVATGAWRGEIHQDPVTALRSRPFDSTEANAGTNEVPTAAGAAMGAAAADAPDLEERQDANIEVLDDAPISGDDAPIIGLDPDIAVDDARTVEMNMIEDTAAVEGQDPNGRTAPTD